MRKSIGNDSASFEAAPSTFWERVAQTRWGRYLSSAEEEALRGAASIVRPGTALDVGCDGGRWSHLLVSLGWSTICVDVSAEAVELCRARLPSAYCVLIQPDDRSFPVADKSIDLFLAYEVEPVTNASWFISEVDRVLSPDGILVCTICNGTSLRGALYRAHMALRSRRRRNHAYSGASFQDMRRELRQRGFDLLQQEGLGWAPFKRCSNARLIPYLVWIERALGLRRLVRFSPLVLVVAQTASRAATSANNRPVAVRRSSANRRSRR